MSVRWNQVAVAAAAGFLLGAVFSDFYHTRFGRMLPPPHPGGPMEMFTRELKLSEPQQKKISAVLEKYGPEMEKVMEENRPRIDAVRLRMKAELKTILTPDQAARLEEMEKDFGPHGPRGPHGDRPPLGRGPGGV